MSRIFYSFLLSLITSHAIADTAVYECKMANGQMSYSGTPCAQKQKEVEHKVMHAQQHSPQNNPLHHSVIVVMNMPNSGGFSRSRTHCDRVNPSAINARFDQINDAVQNNYALAHGSNPRLVNTLDNIKQMELQGCQ